MVRRRGRAARLVARAQFVLLLARLQCRRRVVVVQTLHNVAPHETGDRTERLLLGWLHRRTDHWIALNDQTYGPPANRLTVIRHGDYRSWYRGRDVPPTTKGRLCYFGLIRPYKQVDRLVEAFAGLPGTRHSLHLAGRPGSARLAADLERAVHDDPRMSARLDYVDDDTLAAEIGAAELVVLPYAQFHNSGAVLLALSLGRPVLVPETAVTTALAEEVGPGWVITYPGDLSSAVLAEALAAAASTPRSTDPDLRRRAWPLIAVQHAECYRIALARRGRPGRRSGDRHGRPEDAPDPQAWRAGSG
jgi:beta-1,4-mannosyltransferase